MGLDRQTKDVLVVGVMLAAAAVLIAVLVAFLQGCDPGDGDDGDEYGDGECYGEDCDMACPPDTCADEYNLYQYFMVCSGWDRDGEPMCGCEQTVKPCEHGPCHESVPDYCADF